MGLFRLALISALCACGSAPPPPPAVIEGPYPPLASKPQLDVEGGTFRHPAGVAIDVPGGWRNKHGTDTMAILSPDEEVLVMVLVVDDSELEPALRAIDERIGAYVDGSRLSDGRRTRLNGMKAILADGEGEMDGEPVQLGLALVLTPKAKVVIVIGVARPGADADHAEAVSRFMKSIRPL